MKSKIIKLVLDLLRGFEQKEPQPKEYNLILLTPENLPEPGSEVIVQGVTLEKKDFICHHPQTSSSTCQGLDIPGKWSVGFADVRPRKMRKVLGVPVDSESVQGALTKLFKGAN